MQKNERLSGARLERRCALTYEIKPQSQLIRFVADNDGLVYPDVSARAPGRGVWLSADKITLEKAIKNNSFAKSFKQKTNPKPELIDQTEQCLTQKCLDLLGFAKRAGQLILGYDMVIDSLKKQKPAFLIEASDGSADGRNKILSMAKKWGFIGLIGCFSTEELTSALGRDNLVHAYIPQGQFANSLNKELERLFGFRNKFPNDWDLSNHLPINPQIAS